VLLCPEFNSLYFLFLELGVQMGQGGEVMDILGQLKMRNVLERKLIFRVEVLSYINRYVENSC
jgi:hypothetical protein